jgi:hypothetical protein
MKLIFSNQKRKIINIFYLQLKLDFKISLNTNFNAILDFFY